MAEINMSMPDALVTLPLILESLGGYEIILDGEKGGKTYEKYVFLSIEKRIDYQELTKKIVHSIHSEQKSTYLIAEDIRYEIQSADQKVTLKNLSQNVIGTVDFLERNETEAFLAGILPSTPAKMKHVSKIEELLSVLTLDLADAVIIPERHVLYFIEKSNLNFVVTRLPDVRMGILAFALKNESHFAFKCIKELDKEFLTLLGLDAWKERK